MRNMGGGEGGTLVPGGQRNTNSVDVQAGVLQARRGVPWGTLTRLEAGGYFNHHLTHRWRLVGSTPRAGSSRPRSRSSWGFAIDASIISITAPRSAMSCANNATGATLHRTQGPLAEQASVRGSTQGPMLLLQ